MHDLCDTQNRKKKRNDIIENENIPCVVTVNAAVKKIAKVLK